jgi:hypothetical protein
MPCRKTIKGQEATNMFFEQVWVRFGIPRRIISDRDTIFLNAFWITLWEKMDTKLKRSTTFDLHGRWADKTSQHDLSAAFEGLQSEAYKDLG